MADHSVDARFSVQADAALSQEERDKKIQAQQAHSDATVADQHRANVKAFLEKIKADELKANGG